jgi:hypothetical protein
MALDFTQVGSTSLDLTSDGFTDTLTFNNTNNVDIQINRTSGTGNPLLDFQISNDTVNWVSWELEGFIFKDPTNIFEIVSRKKTFFRLNWLSNTSTGSFTANLKDV